METYLSFEGRIGRLQYLALAVALPVAIFVSLLIIGELLVAIAEDLVIAMLPLYAAALILLLWIGLAAGVRRAHDLGYSGWVMLLGLVPLFGVAVPLLLLFWPGQGETNDYGPGRYYGL